MAFLTTGERVELLKDIARRKTERLKDYLSGERTEAGRVNMVKMITEHNEMLRTFGDTVGFIEMPTELNEKP